MNNKRVCVIGLDGATLDLIQPWTQQEILPNIARLMSTGSWGRLHSTIPPITAPAWSSFMTGKNPGKHGLYDFIGRRPNSYQTRPFNASHRDGESLWSILSRAGKQVCVVNVPITYPPEPVNGCMISGMGTPATAQNYCYPPGLLSELHLVVPDYEVQPEGIFDPRGRELETLQAVRAMTEMRLKAALYLLQHYDCDFFMVVFRATDVVQHYFWHYMDSNHSRYNSRAAQELQTGIRDCYQQIDRGLADIFTHLNDETLIILMSDHGFGIQETYLHMNTWLWQQGYLNFKRNRITRAKEMLFRWGFTPSNTYEVLRILRQARNIARAIRKNKTSARETINRIFLSFQDVDWTRTLAYSVGNIGQIYFNLQGREPQGIVSPGNGFDNLFDELSHKLMELRDSITGEPIVGRIYRQEEVFEGAHLCEAPDLIFMPHEKCLGYGALHFPTRQWLSPSDRSGTHRLDGLLLMHGPGIRTDYQIAGARLIDLAPTILAAMDVPIPSDMDGQVLIDAFTEAFQDIMPIRYQHPQVKAESKAPDLTEGEEHEILEQLRGLGYAD